MRRAVDVLRQRFGVSQRRACRIVGQHRFTQRAPRRPTSTEEQQLRRRDRPQHPRWGWPMAHRLLRRDGQPVLDVERELNTGRGHGW
jgi:putative transposase